MPDPRYIVSAEIRRFLTAIEDGHLRVAGQHAAEGFPLDQPRARTSREGLYPHTLTTFWKSLGLFADKMPDRRALSSQTHLERILHALVPYQAMYLELDEVRGMSYMKLSEQPEYWATLSVARLWMRGCDLTEKVIDFGLDPRSRVLNELAAEAMLTRDQESMMRWIEHAHRATVDSDRAQVAELGDHAITTRTRRHPRSGL